MFYYVAYPYLSLTAGDTVAAHTLTATVHTVQRGAHVAGVAGLPVGVGGAVAAGLAALGYPLECLTVFQIIGIQTAGGGEVVVNIAVNQRGEVISAQIASGGDECMRQTAISAAKSSRFDHNSDAPAKQEGTITYIFKLK